MSTERIVAISFFIVVLLLAAINLGVKNASNRRIPIDDLLTKERIRPETLADIIPIDKVVRPILYADVHFIEKLSIPEAKSSFINIMLPAILIAKEELRYQRKQVEILMQKEAIDKRDSIYLQDLMAEFKTNNLLELKTRMLTHPTSIVLAQAAVESGWGKSRFFKEANNVFGVWSMNSKDDRIPAKFTRNGKQIFLKKYTDISSSIKDYFLTIGKVNAYRQFRAERLKSNEVDKLLPLLSSYSEMGQDYVDQLALMIRLNDFEQYDEYALDPDYLSSSFYGQKP